MNTAKKPIIYSVTENGENAPVHQQGDYDVFVGALEADKLPMYVVINRTTGVVEFTHEVTLAYRNWLDQVAPVMNFQSGDSQLNLELNNALKN